MQPYQEASAVTRRSGETPLNAIKYAAGGAAGTAIGKAGSMLATKALSKVAPFLSQYVPESFAKKGLAKVDGRIGSFISKAEEEGYDFNEIRDFLNDKVKKTEEDSKPPKEDRNIVQQYSPELHQFLSDEIKKGKTPLQAGGLARLASNQQKFEKIIKKIEEDHKTPWSNILESVYGGAQQALPTQQAPEQQNPMQQNQAQQQSGPGNQALMSILQKIQEAKGQM